ncbi:MAG: phage virion morphogenesis protein [Pedobacter sp.]
MAGAQQIFDGSFDDDAVQKRLRDIERAAGDLTPAMKNIGEHMLQSTEENFRTETGPDGQPWQDVSPATRARKRHQKVLTESGHLRGTVNYRANRKSVRVGTNAPYAEPHQFGFDGIVQVPQQNRLVKQAFGKKLKHPVWATVGAFSFEQHIPQREFLGIGRDDTAEIVSILEDHFAGAIK